MRTCLRIARNLGFKAGDWLDCTTPSVRSARAVQASSGKLEEFVDEALESKVTRSFDQKDVTGPREEGAQPLGAT